MNQKTFNQLKRGDIIRHKAASSSFVIAETMGDYVIAVLTRHIANPEEWDLIVPRKAKKRKP